jgi:hypothetical protein
MQTRQGIIIIILSYKIFKIIIPSKERARIDAEAASATSDEFM